jgi:hypothetical protein
MTTITETTDRFLERQPACKECGAVQYKRYGHLAECSQFHDDAKPQADNDPATQPAPDAGGEWRIFGESCMCGVESSEPGFGPRCVDWPSADEWRVSTANARVILSSEARVIARCRDAQTAIQITANHTAVSTLLTTLGELLVEAEVSNVLWHQSRGFSGTVQDAYDKGLMPPAYVRAREAIDAALGTIGGGEGE